jgi:hypothetical protein
MLTYLAKAEIAGIEIRLIKSQFSFVTVYGMERKAHETEAAAWKEFRAACIHAAALA